MTLKLRKLSWLGSVRTLTVWSIPPASRTLPCILNSVGAQYLLMNKLALA